MPEMWGIPVSSDNGGNGSKTDPHVGTIALLDFKYNTSPEPPMTTVTKVWRLLGDGTKFLVQSVTGKTNTTRVPSLPQHDTSGAATGNKVPIVVGGGLEVTIELCDPNIENAVEVFVTYL